MINRDVDSETPEQKAEANMNLHLQRQRREDHMRMVMYHLSRAVDLTQVKSRQRRKLKLLIAAAKELSGFDPVEYLDHDESLRRVWLHWFRSKGWESEPKEQKESLK